MSLSASSYAVVLISGARKNSSRDWAGLVVSSLANGEVVVKPLRVDAPSDDRAPCALRVARECPMLHVDGRAIMERLTFKANGVGCVEKRVGDTRDAPMLGEQFVVDVTEAERAMVIGASPERARGQAVKGDREWLEDRRNAVSSSDDCSLFRGAIRGMSREDDEGGDELGAAPGEGFGGAFARSSTSSSSSKSVLSDEHSTQMREFAEALATLGDDLSSQANDETSSLRLSDRSNVDAPNEGATDEASMEATEAASPEWKGSISFLREQLRRQSGVRLILAREDVERLLSELENAR